MEGKSKSFFELGVWKSAHAFVLFVYRITENYPKSELFGLVSQLRRAAVSIPANIAEGYKKTGKLDKLRFYNISQGSLEECRYYIILSKDLCYIDENTYVELMENIEATSKQLNAYCFTLKSSITT